MLSPTLLILAMAAHGGDASVAVMDDGMVVGSITVEAEEPAVRALLRDATVVAELSSDVISIESEQTGDCEDTRKKTRGMFAPLTVHTRRCPTDDGWSERMVESDDFHRYETDWEVARTGAGTRVTYKVQTDPDLPRRFVLKNIVAGVKDTLEQLVSRLKGKGKKRETR